jgi:FtsH-binding integral membrane protein
MERKLSYQKEELSTTVNQVMKNIFMLMSLALALTGYVSYLIMSNEEILIKLLSNTMVFHGLLIAELIMVIVMSATINKMSFPAAMALFALYSALNGVTLSPLMSLYTEESITSTFFITAGTFGTMALFGYTTKKDLTGIGRILIMALIGIIIATIANIFIGSSQMSMIINYVGVIIFVGLTAYDTQKIKEMTQKSIQSGNESIIPKLSVIGALTLYLDFINLFIKLLKLMGKRK